MAEIPEVVTLTTISKDWGNLVAARTVQRYSSVSNRTTEHPTPAEGDLSYLEDSNTVWVYNGAAWVNIAQAVGTADITDGAVTTAKIANTNVTTDKIADEAVGFTQLAAGAVTSSRISDAAITQAKLAGNVSPAFETDNYAEVVSADLTGTLANVATVSLTIPAGWGSWKCAATATWKASNLDAGTSIYHFRLTIDGTALQTVATVQVVAGSDDVGSVVGRRTGMTTTGSRTIALQANDTSGSVSFNNIALYARAIRLT